MTFDDALAFVLRHEGGATITDDPHDPGGTTKYGISQRAYPDINIRLLTDDDASAIYRRDYWDRCRCDELPPVLAVIVFDSAVNQGPAAAIKALQHAVGTKPDGIIGPVTLAAAQQHGRKALAELVARRAVAYGTTVNFERYGLGWMRRLSACHELAMEVSRDAN